MAKPSYGVIVGRFQVNALHDGHRDLFDQVSARHNRVIVFVGRCPAGVTRDNPLDFAVRERMIKAEFPHFIVEALKDARSDEDWSRQLDAKIDAIADYAEVVLYGGRDSFVPHYIGKYKPVELALDPRKHKISGTDIRKQFSDTVLESSDFRAGMIYALAQLWPSLLPCVDIAPLHQSDGKLELLLGRKPGEKKFRFIGGHAEAGSGCYEKDATRELYEEAHANCGELTYVGSTNIDDWRYAGVAEKKIRTILYRGFTMSLSATPGDDIEEVRWFDVKKLKLSDVVEEHASLLMTLVFDLKQKGLLHAETIQAETVTQD